MITTLPLPNSAVCNFRDSRDANPRYFASSPSFNIEECGKFGYGRINVMVAGYWSRDVITIYVSSDFDSWSVNISHSSGGRLTANDKNYPAAEGFIAVESDMDAEEHFGKALMVAAQVGREIANHAEALEFWRQQQRAEDKAIEQAKLEERQREFDADAPLGSAAAKELVAACREQCSTKKHAVITAFDRGLKSSFTIECVKVDFISWKWRGNKISEEKLIEQLAKISCRTAIAE